MNEYLAKPSGLICVDGKEVASTRQCVHCGSHWIPVKGSGSRRGYCLKCHGHTCGPDCPLARFGCVPFETYLEILEGKIDINNIPIVVPVGL